MEKVQKVDTKQKVKIGVAVAILAIGALALAFVVSGRSRLVSRSDARGVGVRSEDSIRNRR